MDKPSSRSVEAMTIRGAVEVEVLTHSGSVYRVVLDPSGQWWMNADNIPNPRSCGLDPNRWWRIQTPRPWPPELGERLWLMPPEEVDRDDPERIPGGGKNTSPIRAIRRAGDEDR